MKTETRQYKDITGTPCSLDWLVRTEPGWAANQIRHRDKIESELTEAKALTHRLAMALANLNDDAAKEISEYQVPSDVKAALDAYAAVSNIKAEPPPVSGGEAQGKLSNEN